MRIGAALISVALLGALGVGGGCAETSPAGVRYAQERPPGYGEDEELPLGSYDAEGDRKLEASWERPLRTP